MLREEDPGQRPFQSEGTPPVPEDVAGDRGTALCPTLPPDLVYVDDRSPGIRRKRVRGRFAYYLPDGERIRDEAEIGRLNALAVPPAYTHVWLCPDPDGHLQATGRDARGRKQYRYHPRWREVRDASKYERLIEFAGCLPRLRARIDKDLAKPSLSREKVMATVVALLESTLIRVGNLQYARDNRSYGLTTLRNRHVEVRGGTIHFHFRGKSGIEHEVTLKHPRLARIVRRCRELPGQQLFQYLDAEGHRHDVGSADVNAYLHEVTGEDFTAKDYRTWAGTVLALSLLRRIVCESETAAKKQLVEVVRQVAEELGNTPAICRSCYIHPAVMEAFLAGDLCALPSARKRKWLSVDEVRLLKFLEARRLD